ncbi:MAG: alcohol dehydrogenase [Chloroflexi bacterium]|nr:MAG: alcohol dehydrogenase [Phototrophicales bacterium]RMF79319.1 MAG: alcohol dehydrogenase [Chloroflexota bacterium]
MRALIFEDGHLQLATDYPDPDPGDGEALLRILVAGICNTDLELIDGMYDFSGILGHEFVAEVVEGPRHLVGRRVVGEINIACGVCDFCQKDIPSQCRTRHAIGIHGYPGAFADYLVLPVENLHPVPVTISNDGAVFTEPLAAALQVTTMTHIKPDDRVVVLGVGKLGMLVAQVVKITGANLAGIIRHDKQRTLLEQWGITAVERNELVDKQAQIVVDCTGNASGFADALDLVQPRGIIMLKSTYHGKPEIDLTRVAVEEIQIIGSRCGPFDAALRLLEQNSVDVEPMIDGRYPLEAYEAAFKAAAQKGTLKILFDINLQ